MSLYRQCVEQKHHENAHACKDKYQLVKLIKFISLISADTPGSSVGVCLLGIRLIALSGLKTRTVRIEERFIFPTSRQYSSALNERKGKGANEDNGLMVGAEGGNGVPGDDDETVETVPGIGEVSALGTSDAHCQHLDAHLHGKESKDDIICHLKNLTAWCCAIFII